MVKEPTLKLLDHLRMTDFVQKQTIIWAQGKTWDPGAV